MSEAPKKNEITQYKADGKKNAVEKLAERMDLSPDDLMKTLQETAFSACKDRSQFLAAVVVANTYGLNPLLKEMTAFPGKSGGVIPVVMIDGWIKIVNSQPNYDGCEINENKMAEGKTNRSGTDVESVTVKVYLTNRKHPVEVTEYMDECFDGSKEPWKRWPRRMLRHKAYIQAARVAFGIAGIYDEDEKDRIIDAESTAGAGAVVSLKNDKNAPPKQQEATTTAPGASQSPAQEAEVVDDPEEYAKIDLTWFTEPQKAKIMGEQLLKLSRKMDKTRFLAILGTYGYTSAAEIYKQEDLVKIVNQMLKEVQ